MLVANVTPLRIDDFSPGFATNITLLGSPHNMSTFCLNVCQKRLKSLKKRNGYTRRGLAGQLPTCFGMVEWANVTGTKQDNRA